MHRRILILLAHPDAGATFCRALVDAYAEAAIAAGHEVRRLDLATMTFPGLNGRAAFYQGEVPAPIRAAQQDILWSQHLLFVHPLWMGAMPALLKSFLEQAFRPDFIQVGGAGMAGKRILKGRSARIVVTMGMPALFYRWYFGAHGLKWFKRSILSFAGIGPIRDSLIGNVESPKPEGRARWLQKMRALGAAGV